MFSINRSLFVAFPFLLFSIAGFSQGNETIKVKKGVDTTKVKATKKHTVNPTFFYGVQRFYSFSKKEPIDLSGFKFIPSLLPEFGIDMQGFLNWHRKKWDPLRTSFLGFNIYQPMQTIVDDTLRYDLSGYHGHVLNIMPKFLEMPKIEIGSFYRKKDPSYIEMFVSPGFEYGTLKLKVNDLKNSTSFQYSNPFFALQLSFTIKFEFNLTKWTSFYFGFKAGTRIDIGHVAWKNKDNGNYVIPGLDQSAVSRTGFLGFHF